MEVKAHRRWILQLEELPIDLHMHDHVLLIVLHELEEQGRSGEDALRVESMCRKPSLRGDIQHGFHQKATICQHLELAIRWVQLRVEDVCIRHRVHPHAARAFPEPAQASVTIRDVQNDEDLRVIHKSWLVDVLIVVRAENDGGFIALPMAERIQKILDVLFLAKRQPLQTNLITVVQEVAPSRTRPNLLLAHARTGIVAGGKVAVHQFLDALLIDGHLFPLMAGFEDHAPMSIDFHGHAPNVVCIGLRSDPLEHKLPQTRQGALRQVPHLGRLAAPAGKAGEIVAGAQGKHCQHHLVAGVDSVLLRLLEGPKHRAIATGDHHSHRAEPRRLLQLHEAGFLPGGPFQHVVNAQRGRAARRNLDVERLWHTHQLRAPMTARLRVHEQEHRHRFHLADGPTAAAGRRSGHERRCRLVSAWPTRKSTSVCACHSTGRRRLWRFSPRHVPN
mmetsp:Transcript_114252/g.328231  ORF Transcript_114252/g.328231 Transcript_114252/m.328231 type:complete len:447 (+) Transcript_114252:233-1573(+)